MKFFGIKIYNRLIIQHIVRINNTHSRLFLKLFQSILQCSIIEG